MKTSLSDQEKFLLEPLRDELEKAQQLIEELNKFDVRAGSVLQADDKASPRTAVSSQVISQLGHAADSLLAIKIMVFHAELIPSYAAISLTRNAFESIGMALWIIGPGIRDTRVIRTLKTEYESYKDHLKLLAIAEKKKYVEPGSNDSIYIRFTEIKNMRKGNRKDKFDSIPSITKRIKSAMQYANPAKRKDQFDLNFYWNLTSGFSHGRRDAIYNFLDKRVVDVHQDGFSAELTTPIKLLYPLCKIAVDYLEEVMNILRSLNTTDE